MFYKPTEFRMFSRVLILFCLFLLLVLGAVSYFQIYANYASYVYQAGLQMTREEVISNSMLIMEYRPASEHTEALAKLQSVLPLFKQEQDKLQNSTATDTRTLVQQSQPDFLAISSAAQTIVDKPDKVVDPVEVNIIQTNRGNYRTSISLVVQLLIRHSEEYTFNLWLMETIIIITLFLCGVFYLLVLEKRMKHVISEEAAHRASDNTTNKLTD